MSLNVSLNLSECITKCVTKYYYISPYTTIRLICDCMLLYVKICHYFSLYVTIGPTLYVLTCPLDITYNAELQNTVKI